MAYGRRPRRMSGGGIDEARLYRDIREAQRAKMAAGQRLGREATEASQAAGAIEAGKLASARGIAGTGLEGALRGAMSAGSARALSDAEARRNAQLLSDVQSVGPTMLAKEAANESAKAERKLQRASEAGTFASMLGGLGGLGMGVAGALPGILGTIGGLAGGPATLPLLIGGAIASGLGAAGSAGAGIGGAKAQESAADIKKQAAGFEMPGTSTYAQMLSSGPGYGGFETSFLGGPSGDRRRRRFGEEAVEEYSPYSIFT